MCKEKIEVAFRKYINLSSRSLIIAMCKEKIEVAFRKYISFSSRSLIIALYMERNLTNVLLDLAITDKNYENISTCSSNIYLQMTYVWTNPDAK
jgi:hypothetical protein